MDASAKLLPYVAFSYSYVESGAICGGGVFWAEIPASSAANPESTIISTNEIAINFFVFIFIRNHLNECPHHREVFCKPYEEEEASEYGH